MAFQSVKERISAINGLGCLVQALKNYKITIDLENECIVTGIVQEVDGYMNMTLDKVQVVNLNGSCQHYETLFVKGRTIRYIHIPKQLSVRETISKHLKKSTNVHRAEQNTSENRFRQNKRQKYQQETRDNVNRLKELQKQQLNETEHK